MIPLIYAFVSNRRIPIGRIAGIKTLKGNSSCSIGLIIVASSGRFTRPLVYIVNLTKNIWRDGVFIYWPPS